MIKILIAVLVLTLAGAARASAATEFATVKDFDVNRYLGNWHEIARLDHVFERGLTGASARYSLRADGGVDVVNRGWSEKKKKWKEARGRAYFRGGKTEGRLKVSFFRPFYGAYNIIELDENYTYALVAGPNTRYLWILARKPDLAPEVKERLLARAKSLGFPVESLIYPGPGPEGK